MCLSFSLGLYNLLMAYEDKSAYALCSFSFATGPSVEPITFLGKTPVCRELVSNLNCVGFFLFFFPFAIFPCRRFVYYLCLTF